MQLIWKKLDAHYAQGALDLVEGWCRLALNETFCNGGPVNRAKLER